MSGAGTAVTTARSPAALDVYRDDGPLARRVLAPLLGRVLRVPRPALVLAGVGPLLAAIAVTGAGASVGVAAAVVGWFVVVAGASGGRPAGPLDWLVPPLLRLGEYACVLWLAALAGASSLPAAFSLLCVVAFRQYDLVYRLRHRAQVPPAWLDLVSLGWDGRVVVAWVLLAAGALPVGLFVWAGVLGVVLVGESVVGWVRSSRGGSVAVVGDDDEE